MHIPVLQKEVIDYLSPKPNENFIDGTIGGGGHALEILERISPKGRLLGIDLDKEIIYRLKSEIRNPKFENRLILVNDSYANLKEIVIKEKFSAVAGILLDLGFSSWHLEESGRGFSFQKQEPLDMRYNSENQLTAEKIVNFWSAPELEKILTEYGQERFAKEISREIISSRQAGPIENTFQLAGIIKKATPIWYQRQRINPATKTFQALRIAVNDELNSLKKALPEALEILKKGGRLVVISFHSLEDAIIKSFLKERAKENLINILTKKPVVASFQEIKINPRSRSAKLRAAIKL